MQGGPPIFSPGGSDHCASTRRERRRENRWTTDAAISINLKLNDYKSFPPQDLTEVMRSVRTGQQLVKTFSPEERMLRFLRFLRENGMRDEFEKSYYGWLCLAKVNLKMIVALKKSLENASRVQASIDQLYENPLFRALCEKSQ